MEIDFPIEFVVQGTPLSWQSGRSNSKAAWKARVREASSDSLPEGHFSSDGAITVTLFYFPGKAMQGDIDNIVKLVLDALCQRVYADDRQVERVWVQKFEPGRAFDFPDPSQVLSDALNGAKPVLYVRVGEDPTEGLT